MANFEDFLSNYPYPASYLASAHKDSSGASANKNKLSPMVLTAKTTLNEIYATFLKPIFFRTPIARDS